MPHRSQLAALLARYPHSDAEERAHAQRVLEFVRANPDCFERTLLSGHITASAWLVDTTHQRVLLTHHRKLGLWLQLGGHADGEPDVLAAALREAREESGLTEIRPISDAVFDVDIHAIPARDQEPEHFHYDIRFALEAPADAAYVVSPESLDLAWITIGHIVGNNEYDASLQRMAQKWLRQRNP